MRMLKPALRCEGQTFVTNSVVIHRVDALLGSATMRRWRFHQKMKPIFANPIRDK